MSGGGYLKSCRPWMPGDLGPGKFSRFREYTKKYSVTGVMCLTVPIPQLFEAADRRA